MRHAATLDLEQFEDAEIYDKLERARRQTVGRIGLFTLLLATVQDADHPRHRWPAALARVRPLAAAAPGRGGAARRSWARPTSPRSATRCSYSLDPGAPPARLPALHRARATSRPRSSSCSGCRTSWSGATTGCPTSSTRRTSSSPCGGASSRPPWSALGTLGLLRGLRGHHLPRRCVGPGCSPSASLTFLAGSFRQSRDLIQRVLLSLVAALRAEPLPGRPVHLPRRCSRASVEARRAAGAGADPDRVRVRATWVPLSGLGALGGARHSTSRSAPGERIALVGENGAGQDHPGQAAGPALRPDRGTDPARRRGPPRVRPREPAAERRRDLPGLRALRLHAAGEHRGGRDRAAGGRDPDRGGGAAEPGRRGGRAARRAATTRCWAGASRAASTSPAASGRRWRWRGPTCATRSC